MSVYTFKDPDAVSLALADYIANAIKERLSTSDRFTWVLTGGNSPKQLYEILSSEKYKDRIAWEKMHIFWGDERAVPFNDERNNARMTFQHLLDKVPVPRQQIHIMNTDLPPAESAAAYEKILRGYFPETGPSFDLVLSGMGDDGHTLSLFPHMPVIHEQKAWVSSFYLEAQKMYRITLTAPIVNRARKIAFLTFGSNKASALKEVVKGKRNIDKYPSQIIEPIDGELHWFVDKAAAGKL